MVAAAAAAAPRRARVVLVVVGLEPMPIITQRQAPPTLAVVVAGLESKLAAQSRLVLVVQA